MDILKQAAMSYKEVSEYDYTFWLGSAKKKITISILSVHEENFNHVAGLDHLKDVPLVTSTKLVEKKAIFRDIIKDRITYDSIKSSQYISVVHSQDGNNTFTIKERIEEIGNIKNYLDNSCKGKFYKWNTSNCIFRQCTIRADYVLEIPIDSTKSMYFFLKQNTEQKRRKDKMSPMKLYIISAFSDSVRLSEGQQRPFPILKILRKHIKSKEEIELYINPVLSQD